MSHKLKQTDIKNRPKFHFPSFSQQPNKQTNKNKTLKLTSKYTFNQPKIKAQQEINRGIKPKKLKKIAENNKNDLKFQTLLTQSPVVEK